jgi:alpha-amylase
MKQKNKRGSPRGLTMDFRTIKALHAGGNDKIQGGPERTDSSVQTEKNIRWGVSVPLERKRRSSMTEKKYHGDGRDVILQGFHWESHAGILEGPNQSKKSWYRILKENAAAIRAAGFSWVWFPPASDSLAPQGYIPRRWNVLDSAYGAEAELKAAIQALKPVRAMADVVLNHRVGVATAGADFEDPTFPDNRAAIAKDDDSGVGTGSLDTGESHPAGRDLDHTNPDVRKAIKNYLGRLKAIGFEGWRYDLVKGYHGKFVGEYNEATSPGLSVGEYFDGDRQKVTHWIDTTGGKSTAFDFPTRYLLFEAFGGDDFSGLRSVSNGRAAPAGLIGYWPSRSVTFLDNHDTEYRRDKEHACANYNLRHFNHKMAVMGYAYLLTHPGIPCVFWSHYFEWGADIRQRIDQLIEVRKSTGVHAASVVEIKEARQGLYAAIIDNKVAVKLGSRDWCPGVGWRLALGGEKFAVWKPNR